MRTIHM